MTESSSDRGLMHEMGFSDRDIERRRLVAGLDATDAERLTALTPIIAPRADAYTSAFFDYISQLQEGTQLLDNPTLLRRARALKRDHILAMTSGRYERSYVEQRVELGAIYGKAGLDNRVFLGAFHHLLRTMGRDIVEHFGQDAQRAFEHFSSLTKLAFFDIGVIGDALVFERERVIRQQQEAIRELSTPVLQIRERLLLLPIIGVIDTQRARFVTDNLLRSIRAARAKVVVMDVTGVATIDSRVANHLMQTVTAARLMGARVIVTGLSADVAQSLVALGIELGRLNTVGDLQGGVEEAERLLGYRVLQSGEPSPLTSDLS